MFKYDYVYKREVENTVIATEGRVTINKPFFGIVCAGLKVIEKTTGAI